MKLSASNIAWPEEWNERVYALLLQHGYEGLEIAPTKVFPTEPYEHLADAQTWSWSLRQTYGLTVSSMQSIWYGRREKLFGTSEERLSLLEYTKKAILFAETIGCRNLVFGCPVNRQLPEDGNSNIAVDFFGVLGEYAHARGIAIGMEANPPIYNTNFINDTPAALALIRQVNSLGFLLNLDLGTMVANSEDPDELVGNVRYINHVHISEPGLKPITQRDIHSDVMDLLKQESYSGFVSIEMGQAQDADVLEKAIRYLSILNGS